MQTKVKINERGVVTIPRALREAFGLKANDELIVEGTDKGILLRPAISVPIEIYTEERIAEFASDEDAIGEHLPEPEGGGMRVFLDANVLFSASHVGSNVARLIAWLAEQATGVADHLAVEEARRNLALKRAAWLPAFEELIRGLEIVPSVVFDLPVAIESKDAPLLCAAIRSRCRYFVTGDTRDFGHLYGQTIKGVEVISLLRLAEILAAGGR